MASLKLGIDARGAQVGAAQFGNHLNGSLIYAPALLVILLLAEYHYRRRKAGRHLLLVAAAAFAIALALRSIDLRVCAQFETGTHFLWHLLIALVIYLALLALLQNTPARHCRPG